MLASRRSKHLTILGFEERSTPSVADIRAAYKREALRWHPDKNKNPDAKDVFAKLCAATEYLIESAPSISSGGTAAKATYDEEDVEIRLQKFRESQPAKSLRHCPDILEPEDVGTETFLTTTVIWTCRGCKKGDHVCLKMLRRDKHRCVCSHSLEDHDHRGYSCSVEGCECGRFRYLLRLGKVAARCECKHKHLDHSPTPPYACRRSICNCKEFRSSMQCPCGHAWSQHETSFTRKRYPKGTKEWVAVSSSSTSTNDSSSNRQSSSYARNASSATPPRRPSSRANVNEMRRERSSLLRRMSDQVNLRKKRMTMKMGRAAASCLPRRSYSVEGGEKRRGRRSRSGGGYKANGGGGTQGKKQREERLQQKTSSSTSASKQQKVDRNVVTTQRKKKNKKNKKTATDGVDDDSDEEILMNGSRGAAEKTSRPFTGTAPRHPFHQHPRAPHPPNHHSSSNSSNGGGGGDGGSSGSSSSSGMNPELRDLQGMMNRLKRMEMENTVLLKRPPRTDSIDDFIREMRERRRQQQQQQQPRPSIPRKKKKSNAKRSNQSSSKMPPPRPPLPPRMSQRRQQNPDNSRSKGVPNSSSSSSSVASTSSSSSSSPIGSIRSTGDRKDGSFFDVAGTTKKRNKSNVSHSTTAAAPFQPSMKRPSHLHTSQPQRSPSSAHTNRSKM